jgi:hypothetical protein
MGRNKKQSLIDEISEIERLIKNNEFEKALSKLDKIYQKSFTETFSKKDIELFLSYSNSLLSFLKQKEKELKETIVNSIKVKNAYLK